jgi:hypothetical protein
MITREFSGEVMVVADDGAFRVAGTADGSDAFFGNATRPRLSGVLRRGFVVRVNDVCLSACQYKETQ